MSPRAGIVTTRSLGILVSCKGVPIFGTLIIIIVSLRWPSNFPKGAPFNTGLSMSSLESLPIRSQVCPGDLGISDSTLSIGILFNCNKAIINRKTNQ